MARWLQSGTRRDVCVLLAGEQLVREQFAWMRDHVEE